MPRPPKNPNHPLRKLRAKMGLTQAELADRIGMSRDIVTSMEVERTKIDIETAVCIAAATGEDPSQFVPRRDLVKWIKRQTHLISVALGTIGKHQND